MIGSVLRSTLAGMSFAVFSLPAFAMEQQPSLERVFHPLAKIQQAAVYDRGDSWLIKGRITRTDNERWVPPGHVVAHLNNQHFSAAYRPIHIDPMARRASYFSIHIPKQAVANASGPVRLMYQAR